MKYFTYRTNVLVVFFAFLLCGTTLQAAPAYPGMVKFRQPDGTEVNVFFKGDEVLKWAETEDGYSLMYDKDGFLVYATSNAEGDMVPSELRATDVVKRPSRVASRLRGVKQKLMYSKRQIEAARQIHAQRNKARSRAPLNDDRQPVVGKRKFLVILMEFPDCRFTQKKSDFEALMNQVNYGEYGSVRDFYLENSFEKLDLTSDVAGVYMADQPHDYYGQNDSGGRDSYKGTTQLIKEAVEKANPDVNFVDYDNDGDGKADGIHVIFAGRGEEAGGGDNCIWSHRAWINALCDGIHVQDYSCSPEKLNNSITTIGVVCHEIGHVLGAPDFYDTDYGYNDYYPGTDQWDVMAGGNWNMNGACPPHFNPYVKIYDYGWADVMEINYEASLTLKSKDENSFVRINTATPGEYFLLEYRSQSGFDTSLPGHGLMVYRSSITQAAYNNNSINTSHPQQFYPLRASCEFELPTKDKWGWNYGTISINDRSTPFPGFYGKTELSDNTTPSMKSLSGLNTNLPITGIEEYVEDEYVSFDVSGGTLGGAHSLRVLETDTASVSLTWKNPSEQKVMIAYSTTPTFGKAENDLAVGDAIDGGGEIVYVGNAASFVHQNLKPRTKYYYKMYTHTNIGSWIDRVEIMALTQMGKVIHGFPFFENFDTPPLSTSWTQDTIRGERGWLIDKPYSYIDEYKLMFHIRRGNMLDDHMAFEAILKSPIIDFEGYKSACLSFKYSNINCEFQVLGRPTPNEEWTVLSEIYPGGGTAIIALPNLTSQYQIGFRTKKIMGIVTGDDYVSIQNLSITTDVPAMAVTKIPITIGSTYAQIPIEVTEGCEKIIEKGIAWRYSENYVTYDWNELPSKSDTITLSDLSLDAMYTYKAYVKTESGIYYGSEVSFKPFPYTKGEGTEESPFLIENEEDWNTFVYTLQNTINQGYTRRSIDCSGLYFALNTSIELTKEPEGSGIFNGVLDGRGKTITINTDSRMRGLMTELGNEGVIKNLNIHIKEIADDSSINYAFLVQNYGQISNCRVSSEKEFNTMGQQLYPYCYENYGVIDNCSTKYDYPIYSTMPNGMNYVGGICGCNYGIINNCHFDGSIYVNNNTYAGGIAGMNDYTSKEIVQRCGIISNCSTNCDIQPILIDGAAWYNFIGGIAGGNHGIIKQCKSNFTCIAEMGTDNTGGIVGYNYFTVEDSYCNAKIKTGNTEYSLSNIGGLVGYSHVDGYINNCFCMSETDDEQNKISSHEFCGKNVGIINNCYYHSPTKGDKHAGFVSLDELRSTEFVQNLNVHHDVWQNGTDHPILKKKATDEVLLTCDPIGYSSRGGIVRGFVSGSDFIKCGIEWRENNANNWTKEEIGIVGGMMELELSGLSPATLYSYRVYAETSTGQIITGDEHLFVTIFEGVGNKKEPFLLTNAQSLRAFRQMVYQGESFDNQVIKMTQDVDLEGDKGQLWEPIRPKPNSPFAFMGEFDGDGKVIKNLKVQTQHYYAGFFADNRLVSYIHDLHFENGYVECLRDTSKIDEERFGSIGGIVGYDGGNRVSTPRIKRCSFDGVIVGGVETGGIVGYADICIISDCYSKAQIVNTDGGKIGGIVGVGSCSNCYFTGSISAESSHKLKLIGGIVGKGDAMNSFYTSANPKYTNTYGSLITEEELKSEAVFEMLNVNECWQRDNAEKPINQGNPVLTAKDAERVTTMPISISEAEEIVLKGMYAPSTTTHRDKFGFQLLSQRNNDVVKTVDVERADKFEMTVPINDGQMNYYYRAFATSEATDTLFGEWNTYSLPLALPKYEVKTTIQGKGAVSGGGLFYSTSPVMLQATPDLGYSFVGWSDNGIILSNEPNYTFIANKDVNIVAVFKGQEYALTYTAGEHGTIKMSRETIEHDGMLEVTIIPEFGYEIESLIVNNEDVTALVENNVYKLFDINGDVDVRATFKEAAAHNLLLAESVMTFNGKKFVLPVEMENNRYISSLQFNLFLPQGVTFNGISLADDRTGEMHKMAYTQLGDGGIQISVSSSDNTPFSGGDGVLLSILLNAPETMSVGNYDIVMKDVILTDVSGIEYRTQNHISTLQMNALGDVDRDQLVTVTDVVSMVNQILMREPENFRFEAGDIDEDGFITISDVVFVIDKVMASSPDLAANTTRNASLEYLRVADADEMNGSLSLPIHLSNTQAYSAFQMDIVLPVGLTFTSVELTSRASNSHSLIWKELPNGNIRLLAYSSKNAVFEGDNGDLIKLILSKDENVEVIGKVEIKNVIFATPEGRDQYIGNATSLLNNVNKSKIYAYMGTLVVESNLKMEIPLYNVQGTLVRMLPIAVGKNVFNQILPGVYIICDKKIVIE